MGFVDNKKCTVLDIKKPHIKGYLIYCGNFKKRFIELILKINFPEYYCTGTMDHELKILVDMFKKPYVRREIEDPIIIGWKSGNAEDDKTVKLLNIILGGGASEFLEYVLYNTIIVAGDVRTLKLGNFEPINEYYTKLKDKNSHRDNATSSTAKQLDNNSKSDNSTVTPQNGNKSSFAASAESQFDDED